MMIRNPYSYSRAIDAENVLPDDQGLRVYKDTPYTVHIQVRTRTATKGRISGLSIPAKDACELARFLIAEAQKCHDCPEAIASGRVFSGYKP
jgi:hypothetical protein